MLVRELLPGEAGLASRALRELRPDSPEFETPERFERYIDGVQRAEGYRLVASFVEGKPEAVAVVGFRHLHSLASGHYCYVEDVIALPEARKDGHAQALIEWVATDARSLGCSRMELNSGVHRQAAHRFYMNQRLSISAFHFLRELSP